MAELEYPKIDTLYERDDKHFVIVGKLKREEFGIIKKWSITEKVHGINARVTLYEDGKLKYGGRTDDAEILPEFHDYMMKTFTQERMKAVFWFHQHNDGGLSEIPKVVTIYGEGYGPHVISGSGKYRKDLSFRLFDCIVESKSGKWWLARNNLEDVASKLGIKCVPILGTIEKLPASIRDIELLFLGDSSGSVVAAEDCGQNDVRPEGIIAKCEPTLFNSKGYRVMWKLKFKDFTKGT